MRRPGTPLVEVRLRVPFAGAARTQAARAALLAGSLLAGTQERSQLQIARDLQALGAELYASSDADRLMVSGVTLATELPALLELLAEVLTGAAYPTREVSVERDRLAERVAMTRAQPAGAVRIALDRRLFGSHPYGRETPDPDDVHAVGPAAVRRLHRDRVGPEGSLLVLVGDLAPARALDRVEATLGAWAGPPGRPGPPPLPAIEPGPTLVVDRPGAVQSSIRVAGPALPRADPGYPALQLANLIYGGSFSSRLTTNIREDKGYTYTPISRIDHGTAGSVLVVQADVETGVTAPALLEIGYELGRIASLPVTEDELENACQYAIGTLALSVATQAGLASTLAVLAGVGLDAAWLAEHPKRLAAVTVDDVGAESTRWLPPAGMVAVVLGDAAAIRGPLGVLGPVADYDGER